MKVRIRVYKDFEADYWTCAQCGAKVEGEITDIEFDPAGHKGYLSREWTSGGCSACGTLRSPDFGSC